MSKFIEKLKQVFQPTLSPMGFGARKAETARPKLQLSAILANSVTEPLPAADAVIVNRAKAATEGARWGISLKKGDLTEVDKATEAGADFAILPSAGAVLPADRKIGKVLQISPAITDILLRTVNDLPVDAILLGEDKENGAEITWNKLMLCQRFAGMVQKPVLVPVPLAATAPELQLVWETGVSGVVVEVKEPTDAAALVTLRERIDSLQYPSRKRKERLTAVLPQVAPAKESEDEEPDEGDDD